MKILIVGAGIGGLGAAIALAKNGFRVEVFEKAEQLKQVGAGIQLSPNAMQVLAAYGLSGQIEAVAFQPQSGVLRDGHTGKVLTETPFGDFAKRRYGQKYLHIHRADLVDILMVEALRLGVSMKLDAELQSFQQNQTGVSLHLADGRSFGGDVLIGADGLKSTVQVQMFGDLKPRFTGQIAWRATVSVDKLPASCVEPRATVWRGKGAHLVTYLIRSGTLANLVAVEERQNSSDESWTKAGDPNKLRDVFMGWHQDVEMLLAGVEETNIWPLFDRPPLNTWSNGRVTLLGDSCHPMLPFMAQGGAMALEDGYVLADCLIRLTVENALAEYEARRKPRTSWMQKKSTSNAGLFHKHGLLNELKIGIGGLFPTLALKSLDPIYGCDVTKDIL